MLVKEATGNQPDYQLDDHPGYQPDPRTKLIPWAVVSDDEIDDTVPKDHDFGATSGPLYGMELNQGPDNTG